MAKVFEVQGAGQRGPSIAELPWHECRKLFELDDMSRTEDRPKFGNGSKAAIFPTRIVIQIEEDEARQQGFDPGFFESPLPVEQARNRSHDFLGGSSR